MNPSVHLGHLHELLHGVGDLPPHHCLHALPTNQRETYSPDAGSSDKGCGHPGNGFVDVVSAESPAVPDLIAVQPVDPDERGIARIDERRFRRIPTCHFPFSLPHCGHLLAGVEAVTNLRRRLSHLPRRLSEACSDQTGSLAAILLFLAVHALGLIFFALAGAVFLLSAALEWLTHSNPRGGLDLQLAGEAGRRAQAPSSPAARELPRLV